MKIMITTARVCGAGEWIKRQSNCLSSQGEPQYIKINNGALQQRVPEWFVLCRDRSKNKWGTKQFVEYFVTGYQILGNRTFTSSEVNDRLVVN